MAPAILASSGELLDSATGLFKRYSCGGYGYGYGYGYGSCDRSNWASWGRWVVLGVVLLVAFILFFGLACISSRRRRRRGAAPMYGTGWMAPGTQNYNQAYYGQQAGQQGYQSQYGAPQYDMQGQSTGQAQGYYGGNLQTPQQAYQPPAGPPPAKYN